MSWAPAAPAWAVAAEPPSIVETAVYQDALAPDAVRETADITSEIIESQAVGGEAAETPARETRGSAAVAYLADWIVATGDNRGLPFVIIDKVEAEVVVYGADGEAKGAAPALIGSAHGDDSVPGIGERPLSKILPEERTTPAGRFVAGFGPSKGARQVLWVDVDAAISLHQVLKANGPDKRGERLGSPSPDDNRITYGCINVSGAFYEKVVRPTFVGATGVIYVLPEVKPMEDVFPALRLTARSPPPQPARAEPALVEHEPKGEAPYAPLEPIRASPDAA